MLTLGDFELAKLSMSKYGNLRGVCRTLYGQRLKWELSGSNWQPTRMFGVYPFTWAVASLPDTGKVSSHEGIGIKLLVQPDVSLAGFYKNGERKDSDEENRERNKQATCCIRWTI
ncbi:conserved hypothetical protein [Ricinus communis]|uniref:Uncharacterized protein n=1 Tax=Ricinus communis TaxID=3988 RepID=B9RBZ8_RICCO|nr:conserved hypothetical protein [Ricinus communis]